MKILSILVLLIFAPAAYGCGCTDLAPELAFNRADAMFVGKMINDTAKESGKNEWTEATFEIDSGLEIYKGQPGRPFKVKLPGGTDATCEPYRLEPLQQYYVYAYFNSDDVAEHNYNGLCVRIAPYESKEDIDFIRLLLQRGYGTIKGYVSLSTHEIEGIGKPYSVPEINLNIIGPDQISRELPVDKFGNFEITDLRAGTYRLTSQVSSDYESKAERDEITFEGGHPTFYTSFRVEYKSRLTGTIQDTGGVGFDQSVVYLENSTTRVGGGTLSPAGNFEIAGIPPGEYVMYMELAGEDPYKRLKYYFPGTYDSERATKIKIGLSDLRSGVKFTLPAEFRVRKVRGTVRWPDGTPVHNALVFLACPVGPGKNGFRPQNVPSILTGKNGRFSLNGIGGVSYWIQADAGKSDGTSVQSTPMRIALTKDVANLRLVVSKAGYFSRCPTFEVLPAR